MVGELVKGRRQGKGVMHYNDCTEYYGEWSADLKHGHGIFIWSNGDRYEGKLEENAFSGTQLASRLLIVLQVTVSFRGAAGTSTEVNGKMAFNMGMEFLRGKAVISMKVRS